MSSPSTHRLTVMLADGTEHAFLVPTMPRHWKSWIMHQLPYGTTFYGAAFSHTSEETPA